MSLWEVFRISLRSLGANKLRTLLTMLGIIVGVASVVAMMAIGNGAQASVTAQIQSMGANLLFVRPGAASQGGIRGGSNATTLTLEDANAIADPANAPSVALVAPEVDSGVQIVANGQNWNTRVVGTTDAYADVRNVQVSEGNFIDPSQVQARASVVVLGATVAQNIFPDSDPIGQTIRVTAGSRAGALLRVIGVLAPKGGTGFGNQDDQIIVPITTVQYRITAARTASGGQNVNVINIQAVDQQSIQSAADQVGQILRDRHHTIEDDFTIQSQEDTLAAATQVTGVMTILLGSIAGISLLVGGIGIMNIMLVSVTERTREIGIRKAVGAQPSDILFQFTVESVVVSLLGGVAGILLAYAITSAIGSVNLGGQRLTALMSSTSIVLAVGVSAAIGLFFGMYPAWRAARLNPIQALRHE